MIKRKRQYLIRAVQNFDRGAVKDWLQEEDTRVCKLVRDLATLYWRDVLATLESLPDELLVLIFTQLNVKELVQLKYVCWRFYGLSRAVALQTQKISITPSPFLLRHYPNTTHIHISLTGCTELKTELFRELAYHSSVQTLSIQLYRLNINQISLQGLRFPTITRLQLGSKAHRCLCFLFPMKAENEDSLSLHHYFPNLKDFILWEGIESAHARYCSLLSLLNQSLKKLQFLQLGNLSHVEGNTYHSYFLRKLFKERLIHAPKLHTLRYFFRDSPTSLRGSRSLSKKVIHAIPTQMPALRTLELATSLKHLFYHHFTAGFCASALLQELTALSQLQSLVTYCSKIDLHQLQEPGLSAFLHTLPNSFCSVWKLVLCNSRDFSSFTTIALFFEERGITVEFLSD